MNLESGIIIDILGVVIFLFSLIQGARRGFIRTLLNFVQWFLCIFAGFFLGSTLKTFLMERTSLDESVNDYILDQTGSALEESIPYQSIPDLFSQWIETGSHDFIYGTSAAITDVIFTVLAFLIAAVITKAILGLLLLIFSKEHHGGIIGFLDGFIGFLFGGIRGILLLFLILAFLVPILSLMPAETSALVKTAIDDSHIIGFLYDNNLLLILVRDLFS